MTPCHFVSILLALSCLDLEVRAGSREHNGASTAPEAARYWIRQDSRSLSARPEGQDWYAVFGERGVEIRSTGDRWFLGLEFLGLSPHTAGLAPCEQTPTRRVRESRATYAWGHSLEEWYDHGPAGLEHGFTLFAPPEAQVPGDDRLAIDVGIRGDLVVDVEPVGTSARFLGPAGDPVLTYSGLRIWDACGDALNGWMAPSTAGVRIVVDTAGAVYPITVDPLIQGTYLKASNTGAGDRFGWSVAVSGDTAVIGAPLEDSAATGVDGDQSSNASGDSGAAYVFVRSSGAWSQQAYLKASNSGSGDQFGHSVAIDGDTIVVGALAEDSVATGVDGDGSSNGASASGAAYVFVRMAGAWSQQAYLKASNTGANDQFGHVVAIHGDLVAVGALTESSSAVGVDGDGTNNSAPESGACYVFVRSGSTWSPEAYLKASNTGSGDRFGSSVAIHGASLVVGASQEDSAATGVNGDQASNVGSNSGAAYVFTRDGGLWSQQAYLKASNTGAQDNFGHSADLDADTVAIGAPNEDGGATGVNGNQASNSAGDAGAVYVFVRAGAAWSQQAYVKATNTGATDLFGISVAVHGDLLWVGARDEDSSATGTDGDAANNAAAQAGAAYRLTRSGTTWAHDVYAKASNTGTGDFFGASVAAHGTTAVVGAYQEDGGATGVGGNGNDDSVVGSGAAYLFEPGPSPPIELVCFGDGTGTGCPCGNSSTPPGDAGCLNSLGIGGRLFGTGSPSLSADTLVLAGSQMPDSSALYFQGTSTAMGGAGTAFGDGLRCATGTVTRLATKTNVSGASAYPEVGEAIVSVRGLVLAPGERVYQVWYRNAAMFCTASTFNLTNGVTVMWSL